MYLISGNKIIEELPANAKLVLDGILYQDKNITSKRYKLSYDDKEYMIADVSLLDIVDTDVIKKEKSINGIKNLYVDENNNVLISK